MNSNLEASCGSVDPNALHYQAVPLISMAVNVALCTLVLGLSGGVQSSFWPLFLLPNFTACLYLKRRHVLGACLAAGAFLACFYLEAFWEYRRWEAFEFLLKLFPLASLISLVRRRAGGAINKFIGDGAMAVFGVPPPHAEPAAAAARAALRAREAVERLGVLRFGFGINTGLVMAGCLGTKASSEYGIIGAPVNLAARLQEAAGPGQILVGSAAAALLDGRFVLAPERALGLKGIHAPVRAAELVSLSL